MTALDFAVEPGEPRRQIISRGLSAAMQLPSLALVFLDQRANIEFWNDAAERLTGLTETDVQGRSILELLPESHHAHWNKMAAKVRRGRDVAAVECEIHTASGGKLLIQISAAATSDDNGQIRGYVVHLRDVSRLAQEVQRAQHRSAEVQAVVQTVPDGIISLSASGIIQAFNPSAERLFGFRPHEVLGCSVEVLLPGPYKSEVVRDIRVLSEEGDRRRKPRTKEVFAQRKDASRFACEISMARLKSDHVDSAIVAVFRDITYRKAAEEKVGRLNVELREKVSELGETLATVQRMQSQLVEAEKMASLGALVAGIAHEINTPIGICFSASTLLTDSMQKVRDKMDGARLTREGFVNFLKTAGESADLIDRNIRRASDLVGAFKKTAVEHSQERARSFNLASLVSDVVTSVSPMWRNAGHRVKIDCPGDIEVFTSAGALVQIMTNLISNAVTHAFKDDFKGVIGIRASRIGPDIELRVSDNGSGMTDSIRRKIFDPFFTTRHAQGGTGLGLHVTYNLAIQAMRGSITVESAQGVGSEFLLRFPSLLDKPVAKANDVVPEASDLMARSTE